MEISGVNSEGKVVRASVQELGEKLKQKGEDMTYGSSPTHVVYSDRFTGKQREVDLQEVSQASGLKSVDFHLDIEQARKAGAYEDKDIDQATAYNLERIKSNTQRQQYLADKGHKPGTVFKDGDDYYSFVNGKLSPINNRPGFDVSDLTRMAAHAGRDIGATIGSVAAIGGGAVAAVPSGGTSIVAAAALSGGAAMVAGSLGEEAQRAADRIAGNDAAKYNARMGVVEELQSRGQDALVAGVAGVAQPFMNAATAKLGQNIVAPIVKNMGDWGKTAAAKLEMAGAMALRMPQGWGQKFASEGTMAASSAMAEGRDMLTKGTLKPGEAEQVTRESLEMLSPGRAKPPAKIAAGQAEQAAMRSQYESATIQKAKERSINELSAQAAAKAEADAAAASIAKNQQTSQVVFAEHKKDIEVLFDPEASLDTATAAQRKIVTATAQKAAKSYGMKLDTEAVTGLPTGFEQESFDNFVQKQYGLIFDGAADSLNASRQAHMFLQKAAPDAVKQETSTAMRTVINNFDPSIMNGELKGAAKSVLEAIEGHNEHNTTPLRDAVEIFHNLSAKVGDAPMPGKSREALDTFNGSLHVLEVGSTYHPDVVNGYYAGLNKLMETKGILAKNRGAQTPELFEKVTRQLDQLARTTFDHEGASTQNLINAVHMQDILAGSKQTIADMLSPDSRVNMKALEFVSSYAAPQKEVLSTNYTKGQKLAAGAAGMVLGHLTDTVTGSPGISTLMMGKAAYDNPAALMKGSGGIRSLLGPVVSGAKALAEKTGKAASEVLAGGNSTKAAAARMYGTEQFEEKKLREWRK